VAHDATTPFTVQLIPGSQHWFYSGGTYQYFSVAADGTVDYDPALEGALTGRGTSTLAINGGPCKSTPASWARDHYGRRRGP